jgi:hypothetical protein
VNDFHLLFTHHSVAVESKPDRTKLIAYQLERQIAVLGAISDYPPTAIWFD